MSDEQMRAEFEEWAAGSYDIDKYQNGSYLNPNTRSAWYVWQAARAQDGTEVEPVGDYWGGYEEGIKASRAQVPQEPTQEMCIAAMQAWDEAHKEGVRQWPEMMGRIYKAMLAASPKPPEE